MALLITLFFFTLLKYIEYDCFINDTPHRFIGDVSGYSSPGATINIEAGKMSCLDRTESGVTYISTSNDLMVPMGIFSLPFLNFIRLSMLEKTSP